MIMGRHLRMTVYAVDADDKVHCFTPADDVPEWVVAQIGNDDAWAPDPDSAPDAVAVEAPSGNERPDGGDDLPPQGGPGSGLEEWLRYADDHDIDVPNRDKRGDVIEAVEAWRAAQGG